MGPGTRRRPRGAEASSEQMCSASTSASTCGTTHGACRSTPQGRVSHSCHLDGRALRVGLGMDLRVESAGVRGCIPRPSNQGSHTSMPIQHACRCLPPSLPDLACLFVTPRQGQRGAAVAAQRERVLRARGLRRVPVHPAALGQRPSVREAAAPCTLLWFRHPPTPEDHQSAAGRGGQGKGITHETIAL